MYIREEDCREREDSGNKITWSRVCHFEVDNLCARPIGEHAGKFNINMQSTYNFTLACYVMVMDDHSQYAIMGPTIQYRRNNPMDPTELKTDPGTE